MLPFVIQFPESSEDPMKGEGLSPPRHFAAGRGGESQRQDLALCPCRSGARFYCNPYILLQILNQLVPRLGWTLW